MTDTLSRVITSTAPIISDPSIDEAAFNNLVESDARLDVRSGYLSDDQVKLFTENRSVLSQNPRMWKNELIKIKQNVEMTLTSLRQKIAHTNELLLEQGNDADNYIITYKKLDALRVRRINTVRFLHALESRFIDVNNLLRMDE
jgi:hypothetical protein